MLARTPIQDLALPAETLKVTNIERDALCAVLTKLESGELDNRFHMHIWGQVSPCGTVGCIAGHANAINAEAFPGVGGAKWIYGLPEPLQRLFMPDDSPKRTPAEAAQALRSFLTTGEAVWVS